jgi:hypothetical protein
MSWVECPECVGLGLVQVQYTNGGIDRGNPWQSYRARWVECESCGGDGEVEQDDDE